MGVMAGKERISTDGGNNLGQNPFAALSGAGLSNAPAGLAARSTTGPTTSGPTTGGPAAGGRKAPNKNRGRVDIVRSTAGRAGRTVTVVSGFVGIGLPEKEQLAKKMQRACGSGGTVKDGCIEVQGDQREVVARILTEAGFRPVFAGG
jgi:translation initiation factor 1